MPQIYFTIYRVTNTINGKIYIGQHKTYNLNDDYMGSGKLLLAAQKKYGIENFKKEILFVLASEAEMNAKEKELVTENFCNQENTYNICLGGQGGFSHINSDIEFRKNKNKKARQVADKAILQKYGVSNPSQIPEVKEKLSKNLKERYEKGFISAGSFANRTDHLEKLNSAETAQKRKETYKKIGHSQGNKNSQFGTMWITNNLENKKIKNTDIIPNGWNKGRVNNNMRL